MILSRRVSLHGVQLDEVHSAVIIRSVDPGTPKETLNAVSPGAGAGQRITKQHYTVLEAKVTYAIDLPKTDLAARRAVFDAVNAWAAAKGWLTTNEMPGRRMHVDYVQVPSSGDLWEWTEEFTITFRAYAVPFWEDTATTTVTLTQGSTGSGSITIGGTTESAGEATVQNKSGSTISTVSMTVNGHTMAFSGIGLANNGYLTIDHAFVGTSWVLRAKIGNTSVLKYRTGDDEFVLKPGSNSISFTAGGSVIATVSAKGRYL